MELKAERLLDRNARLVVLVRHVVAEYHRRLHKGVSWTTCGEELCRHAKEAIEKAT